MAYSPDIRLASMVRDDNPLVSIPPKVTSAVQHSWHQNGGSLQVQGEMPLWLEQAGLRVEEVRQVSGLARPGTPKWGWPEGFLESYLPELEQSGLLQPDDIEACWQDWRRCARSPGSFVYLPPLIEIRARKPESG